MIKTMHICIYLYLIQYWSFWSASAILCEESIAINWFSFIFEFWGFEWVGNMLQEWMLTVRNDFVLRYAIKKEQCI